MKTAELRDKSDTELESMLGELRDQMQDMRFKLTAKQMKNMADAKKVRRTIATILTLKKERALGLVKKSKPVENTKKSEDKVEKGKREEGEKGKEAEVKPAKGPEPVEAKETDVPNTKDTKKSAVKAKRAALPSVLEISDSGRDLPHPMHIDKHDGTPSVGGAAGGGKKLKDNESSVPSTSKAPPKAGK